MHFKVRTGHDVHRKGGEVRDALGFAQLWGLMVIVRLLDRRRALLCRGGNGSVYFVRLIQYIGYDVHVSVKKK